MLASSPLYAEQKMEDVDKEEEDAEAAMVEWGVGDGTVK